MQHHGRNITGILRGHRGTDTKPHAGKASDFMLRWHFFHYIITANGVDEPQISPGACRLKKRPVQTILSDTTTVTVTYLKGIFGVSTIISSLHNNTGTG